MDVLRTPDARFAGLPGWPYEARVVELDDAAAGRLRMAYVDEGPRDAAVTALCLHGQPTWGYLYRKMLPVFTGAGLRVVVPDLIGFGRSDKPVDDSGGPSWYTFDNHRNALLAFVERLDPKNVLLVCQDWGGVLGLTMPMAAPERYKRLLVMNTGLGTGTVTEGFLKWRAYNNAQPDLAVGKLLKRGCPMLSDAEAAAYDAPFPDVRHKAGVRAFPNLVPDSDEAPGAALSRAASVFFTDQWQGDTFMAIGMQDPVLGEAPMRSLARRIRGCPPPLEVAEAGHFVQEWGAPIARAALAHFKLG
ncbi:MAG: alpha/beta fold hydrolase [Betaproteobacteria bacterium]|nr:alpha/beta fold hydrolase [Betaproteobacteria bacterium]MCC6248989.1 alpha/beta fold hydrolase [Rubrivivax sp.]